MCSEEVRDLLQFYTATPSWADRPAFHKPWRPLRGEGVPLEEDAAPAAADSFANGSRYLGLHNFEIGEILGEGNYSQVFACTLKPTQEQFAFKIVDKQKVQRYKKQDEVLVEKWVLTNVLHPSMIKLYQTFQDTMALYLVLEFVPGGELWSMTHKRGLRRSLATFYVAELLEVLQYLHEHDVVHRDINHENVLHTKQGHIKLIDFGTAKLLNQTPLTTTANYQFGGKFKEFVGTPEYMAPEAINNKPADWRADLWSLGCFVCQLLFGMPHFKGGSDYLTFKRALGQHYILPGGMPDAAVSLIESLCVIKPSARLGGAAEINQPSAARHGLIRAHPFFSCLDQHALLELRLHEAPIPVPTLSELCLPVVADRIIQGGWSRAAMRGPMPSAWPAQITKQVTFEIEKRDSLSDELRVTLGLGPAPTPIDVCSIL